MKYKHIPVIILSMAFTVSACRNHGGKDISEGEIHYSIEYSGNLGKVPKELLPKNLIVSFKQNKVLFEMTSVFGNSGIINLSNPKSGIYDTYFSLFALKYYCELSEGELFPGLGSMDGIEIDKTSGNMDICGFRCKHAEVTLPSDRDKIISIWYTDEIDVRGSNLATPFEEIDGVLLDFFFRIGEAEIHFSAENIYSKEINDNIFERRTDYTKATQEDINGFISKMVNF
ncbi:MAG: hypothetical protein LBV26_06400 [Bacteroidales bacterium]|nr:hypothetical protein [Bacteroidales bacterium]